MNDEHLHPVPDESRSCPTQKDDDIAALEREARAKREAVLHTWQDDDNTDPIQPTVNKLKSASGKPPLFWHSLPLP